MVNTVDGENSGTRPNGDGHKRKLLSENQTHFVDDLSLSMLNAVS